jgi:hypothetical protein
MKLCLVVLLAFTAFACDKTIHEVRVHPDGRPAPLVAPADAMAQAR